MYSSKNQHINATELNKSLSKLTDLAFDDLEIDSRKVKPGVAFCAYPGVSNDGRNFIDKALALGASAIIYEKPYLNKLTVASLETSNLMHQVGILAAAKYGNLQAKFPVIGVTGTNGKTSITHWIAQAFNNMKSRTALIGTTGSGIYPNIIDYESTTPDPITLQRLIKDFIHNDVKLMAMEVSSHALDQGRVNGITFDTAVFTNLTQDHLNYHHTMDNYFLAKEQLFYWSGLKNAIINADDEYGARLINELNRADNELKLISYGLHNGNLQAKNVVMSIAGVNFDVIYNNEKIMQVHSVAFGDFNVYNLLALIGVLLVKDISLTDIQQIVANLKPVTGRMDAVVAKDKPLVIIDYAHTPDALENVLQTLNQIKANGKLYCVFGCGGDRDRAKRSVMGAIVQKFADVAIVTSDNPRSEDPEVIIHEVTSGMQKNKYLQQVDRKKAIKTAVGLAKYGDVILIAGKGHETYQEIHGIKYPFSDMAIVQELLDVK